MSLFDSASLVVTPNGTKASKLYAIKPTDGSGDLVVTRATTATRVNASGLIESVATNVPRLDYTNSSCPSILVEPQRTNVNLYSEQFDNAYWVPQNVTLTANNTISPSGSLDADLVNVSATNGEHNVYSLTPIVITANVDYTFSYFVKKGTGRYACVLIYYAGVGGGFGPYATYDLNTNTLVASGAPNGTFTGTKIETLANGWVRISVTGKGNFISAVVAPDFRNAANLVPGNAFTGTNETYSIWGAQLEAGSYATSYIPTVASSVTRNADVISKTGISSLIGQTEGTIFMDLVINNLDLETGVFGVQKISTNSTIRIGSGAGGVQNLFAQCFNGSSNLFFEVTPYTLGSRVKIAFAYKAGSYAFYINGVQIATGTNATTMPTCDDFFFAKNFALGNNTAAKINSTLLYKTRLSNTELATLTTI